MQELNMKEVDAVSGAGWASEIAKGVAASAAWDAIKTGATYLLENSHMGQGNFPPVPRAGHE